MSSNFDLSHLLLLAAGIFIPAILKRFGISLPGIPSNPTPPSPVDPNAPPVQVPSFGLAALLEQLLPVLLAKLLPAFTAQTQMIVRSELAERKPVADPMQHTVEQLADGSFVIKPAKVQSIQAVK